MNSSISNHISQLRQDYQKHALDIADTDASPFVQFETWFKEALETEVPEPNAMTVATVDAQNEPDARILLLKGFDTNGFNFYTNYESAKARQLEDHPKAALTFLWLELERQVRIRGTVKKLPAEVAERYFQSRPRESQIGAWCSSQSAPLENRQELEDKKAFYIKKFEQQAIPKPDFWGGYQVQPTFFEFWQGRASRLHDRIQYHLIDGAWTRRRVYP